MRESMRLINQEDAYLFHTGNAQRAYLHFGAHRLEGGEGYRFCLYAPNAAAVSVVGDFNGWDARQNPMEKGEDGILCAVVPEAREGQCYKYHVEGYDGRVRLKADPFAFLSEIRPNNASVITELSGYEWGDAAFMQKRAGQKVLSRPVSIYELHPGSWKRKQDGSFYSYRELADLLAPYLKRMGFTHLELLPVTEHPFDGSWGYQVTGYFAVTSRYGTPQDFMYLIDTMHQNGIGVLLDWVPAHFPRDEHGLARFDGTCLYEHENPLQGEQPQWGTLVFNYGRPEVVSFLISSAMFFFDVYHIDGLRIDAVSSMLYLDFGRAEGQYIPNRFGDNRNLEAIAFLQRLNEAVLSTYPGAMTVAEESSAYPLVTKPPYDGGLGFTFKWDMGFMNDTLDYMGLDPLFRKDNHNKLTFSMLYAFSENHILPFSHDEVVHGKRSMVDKMPGDYWKKFASLRALYGYQFAHPGKKLLFMGDEFAQFIEWDEKKELDWFLDEYEAHHGMSEYVKKLNHIYQRFRALYEIDDGWDGFEWRMADDRDNSVIAFVRQSRPWRGRVQKILCVMNFTPVPREHYWIAMPERGQLRCILNSDAKRFYGSGYPIKTQLSVDGGELWGCPASVELTLPPLSAVYYEFVPENIPAKRRQTQKHGGK